MRRCMIVFAASVFLCAMSYGQEQESARRELLSDPQPQPAAPPPSLGEIARQLKLKKQQKEAQLKQAATPVAQASDSTPVTPEAQPSDSTSAKDSATTAHLVTNDDTPARASVTPVSTHSATEPADSQTGSDDHRPTAEQWKSQILQQKNAIAALQEDIKTTSNSIHYAGANCVANCAQWNERQQQKQQEVDSMKAQLEDAQKQLEEMQEAARKEGFGSAALDP